MRIMDGLMAIPGILLAIGLMSLTRASMWVVIVAITIGAIAEAMVLVSAGGADRAKFREAIRGGFCESRILELHGGRMVARDFAPGGPSRLQLKDLNTVAALAGAEGLTLPLTEAVRGVFQDFVAQGHGDTDHSGLLLLLESMNRRPG